MIQSQAELVTCSIYVCVCVYKFQPIRIYLLLPTFLFNKTMSSEVWVGFSFVNSYIKSTSKRYHMRLAFLRHTCFPSLLPFMLLRNVFGYASLWLSLPCLSGAVLPYPFIVHGHFGLSCLDFGQYWVMWGMLGCLCLLQQRRFPLHRGPAMGVPDDMNAFFFIVSQGTSAHLSR